MDAVEASTQRTVEAVKEVVASVRGATSVAAKMELYDSWAQNYEQDVAVLGYDAATHAAKSILSYFRGERDTAVVLDVACGTGLVARKMTQDGFRHFVGVDGSETMLEEAQKKGLYRDLKKCILGEQPLPIQGGGWVCMTCRGSLENLDYLASLEEELKLMEDEGLWRCVSLTKVEKWSRTVSASGEDSGSVYLYQKL